MDISGAPDEGYVAFGIGESQASIGSISLTMLDEPATPAATAIALNNKAADNRQVIAVNTADGVELKAGSLRAVDAAGNVYVPTRVGFRDDTTRTDLYAVPTDADVQVVYDVIVPTAKKPNVGNVGTSINSELDGLRFVSRLNRVKNGEKEYITLGGVKCEVVDYGMLVAFDSVVKANNGVLDIALSEKYGYVKKVRIYEATKTYYDVCDKFVDTSVCITNLDNLAGGKDIAVTARAYVTVLVGGKQQTLYADAFTSSYNANV
jgi:hypothetical protein